MSQNSHGVVLPTRQIHLDFHTSPLMPDVGNTFDGKVFAETLKNAGVNSVTLFAKCHHGHLYYVTSRPERHPNLVRDAAGKVIDLLGLQIEACKRVGIATPIYISVQCDEYAANTNPGWICRNPDGTNVGRRPLAHDAMQWQILDMSSPYQDFLAEQIAEVVKKYRPVDGIFLDMCWDQPSVSRWAVEGMRKAGLSPADAKDRATYARSVVRGYMQRYNKLIGDLNGSAPKVWYNSRPKTELLEEKQYLQHIELEALPTGGWGYTYFPLNVRWARNFGLPFIGMTARFHKSWSDFGGFKPDAALKYEVSQMLAHGGGCSIGDQLHPLGHLDAEAYKRIGAAYRHVASVEKWCIGAVPVTEVAVLREPGGSYEITPGGTLEGAVRLLQQIFVQFDFVAPLSDLRKYRVVVVPEGVDLGGEVGERLAKFSAGGGKVVLAGPGPLESAPAELRERLGVAGVSQGKFETIFFRYDAAVARGFELSDVVMYEGSKYLTPAAGAVAPAVIVEPLFQRSWDKFCGHNQTPPAAVTAYVPATVTDRGAAIGFDPFKTFGTHGQAHVRRLFGFLLSRLLPEPLVKADLPTHAELTVTRLGDKTVIHLLSYAPQRRTPTLDIVEEATPLVARRISVRLAEKPKSATRYPVGEVLEVSFSGGYASVTITSADGHDVIVFD